jgi:hypothetical protein
VLFAPHGTAWQLQSIARHNQHKPPREFGSAGYLYRRSGSGEVADQAIDGVAAELNRSGFQDVVAGCSAMFGHGIRLRKKSKKLMKFSKKGPLLKL